MAAENPNMLPSETISTHVQQILVRRIGDPPFAQNAQVLGCSVDAEGIDR